MRSSVYVKQHSTNQTVRFDENPFTGKLEDREEDKKHKLVDEYKPQVSWWPHEVFIVSLFRTGINFCLIQAKEEEKCWRISNLALFIGRFQATLWQWTG